MDKKKIEVLNKIQELRDKDMHPDFESLEKQGFERSILRVMIKENLINWGGVFSLTGKGEKTLRDYLLIESSNGDTEKLKVIFDSNVFDDLISENLNINDIIKSKKKIEYYITHLQVDEINECPDEEKRAKLFLFMGKIGPIIIPTTSFVLGKSRLGEARLGDGIIFEDLKKGNIKHTEDALIGETAIKENLILVTNDVTLRIRLKSKGGKTLSLERFKERLNEV